MSHAPGRDFSIVVGILFIVFGVTDVLASFGGFTTTSFLDDFMPARLSWNIYYGFMLFMSGFSVFAGIMGITNANKPERASLLRLLGIVVICFIMLDILMSSIFLLPRIAVLNTLSKLAFPLLFIVGAQKNLQAQK